ncbi:helix-turn-helix domain-containing protein [Streptomyces sp. NBC_00631]|uniref:helix-turn-helix domain-containing protein n=1 Tax=Streptomyces sp. NBC_00631 TaxID=2975793 RepID=UPI0030E20557
MDSRPPGDARLIDRSVGFSTAASELLDQTVSTLTALTGSGIAASYRTLAETDGPIPLADADRRLGGPGNAVRLLDLGLAHVLPHDPPVLAAAAPVPALEAALAHKQHELNAQYDLVARSQREAAHIRQLAHRQAQEATSHRLARVLTDSDDIAALSNTIGTAATAEHLTLETFRYDLPLSDGSAQPPTAASIARGVRHRSIYEAAFLSDPVGARIIERCAAAGEEIRLLPRLQMKLKVTDGAQALLALTPTGSSAALHLTSPVAVDALRHYFELLWREARPLTLSGSSGYGDREGQRHEIAALMRQGLKDEAIARRLGLTPRTVRRRISEFMEELAAETRFAAGAEAQRRGWFDAPAE